MPAQLKILMIEDVLTDFMLVERYLRQHTIIDECKRVSSNAELTAALTGTWHILLSDYNVPGMDIRATLLTVKSQHPELPIILVSGSIGEESAVEMLHLGVNDFVLKGNLLRLPQAIERSLELARQKVARLAAEQALRENQAQR